jgi:hypothetical protein
MIIALTRKQLMIARGELRRRGGATTHAVSRNESRLMMYFSQCTAGKYCHKS